MIQVTKDNYEEVVEKSDKPVILDFYADWCGPCKKMEPIFEELIASNAEKVVGAKVDIEKSADLAEEFGVRSIPCFVFFKEGKEIDRIVGAISPESLSEKVEAFLS